MCEYLPTPIKKKGEIEDKIYEKYTQMEITNISRPLLWKVNNMI